MKIAVFGSKGYLGSQLAYYFRGKKADVDEFDLPEFDITAASQWENFNPGIYDTILFFAGLTGTEASFVKSEAFLSVNEFGLMGLLNKLAPLGDKAPYIVFPSTRLVYKGSDFPLREDAPKEAKTVYAANKLAGEALLQAYSARFGLRYSVVRICVPYGNLISHDYSYGTIGAFIRQAKCGVINLFGGGMVRRTFTNVSDVCGLVYSLAHEKIQGIYNIGGTDLSLYEAASVIAERMGAIVKSVDWPEAAKRIESGSTVFDSGRLDVVIGPVVYCDFEKTIDI